jgi:hypothetical protein
MRLPRLVALVACALCCVSGCGGDDAAPVTSNPTPVAPPPAPPPPVVETVPRVQGAWRGTFEMQFNGVKTFGNVRMTLTQTDRTIQGTWNFEAPWDWVGDVSGVINGVGSTATFAGSTSLTGEIATRTGKCHGQMTLSGSASDVSLRWTSPGVILADCTGAPAGIVWILGR